MLSTFTVTNTSDSGAYSFRDAITQVNADPGTDTTRSTSRSQAPAQTISPLSALPTITHSVVIDGTSQPGYAVGAPLIELNGTSAGSSTSGLILDATNSTIEGLVINRFQDAGVVLLASNDVVQENFIGTDTTGTMRSATIMAFRSEVSGNRT